MSHIRHTRFSSAGTCGLETESYRQGVQLVIRDTLAEALLALSKTKM